MKPGPESPLSGQSGSEGDVVVSSRVRLARNLAGFPFVGRASDAQRREVVQAVVRVPISPEAAPGLYWVHMGPTTPHDRQLLVERHLVSRNFAAGELPRAVGVSGPESLSVMVNEEDHLRIQSMAPGLDLDRAYAGASRFDEALGEHVDYAFHPRWGHLTACPTNVGCGIRVSVMLHLPGLKLTGELERVKRAAKDLNLAVRGFYGEGTEAIGSFFQISNQVTLGVSEEELLLEFGRRIVPQMVAYEREARAMLLERSRLVVEDKVWRALSTLQSARLVTAEEALKLLSSLRFGVALGLVRGVALEHVGTMLLRSQPAHMASADSGAQDEQLAKAIRATYLREALRGAECV